MYPSAPMNQPPMMQGPYPGVMVPQVVTTQPNNYQSADVKWTWCNLVTSAFSVCFCQVFGLIAIILAMLAYVDHKARDYTRSRSKRNCAWGFAISGIVIGALTAVAAIIAVAIIYSMVSSRVSSTLGAASSSLDAAKSLTDQVLADASNTLGKYSSDLNDFKG